MEHDQLSLCVHACVAFHFPTDCFDWIHFFSQPFHHVLLCPLCPVHADSVSFAYVTFYLCVVRGSVSCLTSPVCDLCFHLLSLKLLEPTGLSSQPATPQKSPDMAATTHTQSYVQIISLSSSHTCWHIKLHFQPIHTHAVAKLTQTGFCFCHIKYNVGPQNKHQNTFVTGKKFVYPPVWLFHWHPK